MNPSFDTMDSIRADLQPLQTLTDFFYYREKQHPDKLFLRQPVGDRYIDFTWGEVGRQARIVANYLNSIGLPPKSNIGILSKNCAHWIIADIAILLSGHVSVPFYPTLTRNQLGHVLHHSGCAVLFAGKLDNWQNQKPAVPADTQCVAFPDYCALADLSLIQWDDILAQYEPMTDNPRPWPEDLFTIIYTSGTTGNPKGVMMNYRAMASAIENTKPMMRHDVQNARFFSYLPLCHVAERNFVEATSIITGGTIYFTESLETFTKNLTAARPTHFLAVPRIWHKFQQAILAKISQKTIDRLLRLPILSQILKTQIRQRLGLSEAKLILTGAAPMPVSLIQWFRRLGIAIQEAYGMTENLGVVSMMPSDKIKDGTVGKAYPGMDIKIDAATSEILTRAEWLMSGYYHDPAMTNEVLHDGWLHTGDVGHLDQEGYLQVRGRLRDLYKTSKGEYVIPTQIEAGFADNHLIEQVCVMGQTLPQPIALVVLSDLGRQNDRRLVKQFLEETVERLNGNLQRHEQVKKVVIVKDPWTVDNNLVTPTLKIKRNVVEDRYEAKIAGWYEETEKVIWEA
ncbi:AMP-binding protein [Tellurirhabdus bombi]|uniref:AMP-binding protein n=1 Tax=Tellurirhabdus bombi TaxID=2907205 RepID=UPI001F1CFC9E|nr:AMP-binding protein [Tellurirhabdus bombi]